MRSKLFFALRQVPLMVRERLSPPLLDSPGGTFVVGINLGGAALRLAGHDWIGYRQALEAGLAIPGAQTGETYLLPQPAISRALCTMLNTVVYRPQSLELSYPLPDGTYHIYLWMMENYQSQWHSFDLLIAGRSVAQGIGQLARQQWRRYGPYEVNVTTAGLELALVSSQPQVDAHLMGLSVFKP